MGEKKKEAFSPPALGGSSLLVAFAVLALTVFALLSLSTVRADVRLGDAAAAAVKGYYEADVQAQEILARLRNGETPVEVTAHGEDSWHDPRFTRYTYAVPISDTQELQVEVLVDRTDGSWSVLRWQSVPVGEWEPDTSLTVWDGGMNLF
ncbi:MAG: hypothetical protein HFF40_01500 [Lawsonibacter sp.]|jgi:hypothetical protein|nr:hypothetical protein [Lawsonibacter sp.]MCI9267513.1 hypothetical protein [Lawsonibacter sp.]